MPDEVTKNCFFGTMSLSISFGFMRESQHVLDDFGRNKEQIQLFKEPKEHF